MFHNIHPHGGENWWSQYIQTLLFRYSYVIIAHSREASLFAQKKAVCPVYYKPHPIEMVKYELWEGDSRECDFFIWGSILPYKGIEEFISNPLCKEKRFKILIIGKCIDKVLKDKIVEHCSDNIIFEDRRADYSELSAQCKKAKCVLFPYIGDSISSSGVLIDTLLMGGIPIGPNRGAFADLRNVGCCFTYNTIEEVFNLNLDDIQISPKAKDQFVDENTWSKYAAWMFSLLSSK